MEIGERVEVLGWPPHRPGNRDTVVRVVEVMERDGPTSVLYRCRDTNKNQEVFTFILFFHFFC
jgi:hypothetical protein